jgi:hypothetical protein
MAKLQTVHRIADVDIKNIVLGPMKTQDNGGKMIYLQHIDQPLFVQLPVMTCPYGISSWPIEKGAVSERLNLDLSLVNYDTAPHMKDAYNLFTSIEEFAMNKALENSTTWFKKKYTTKDVIQAIFTPMVRFSKDKETGEITHKYPPVIRLSLPKKNDQVDVEVYNDKREKIPFDSVDFRGSQVTAIVQIVSVWVIAGKFGISVRAKQLKVSQTKRIIGYAFIEDPDDM